MPVNASVRKELASLYPSAIIELFEIKTVLNLHGVCDTYRFHAGVNAKSITGHMVWAGKTYYAWPIEAEGFEVNSGGSLPRPKIRIANIEGTITTILLELLTFGSSDLAGAEVTRIRTLARFLDAENFDGNINPFGIPDPQSSLPDEIYYIDRKSAETREFVEFELAAAFDLGNLKLPRRQCLNNICQWQYRGEECTYSGTNYFDENDNPVATESQDICGKRLTSCEKRFGANAELPYGGYPGVGQYVF